jgi:hypothetical protein
MTTTNPSHEARSMIVRSLVMAALFIGAAFLLKRLTPGYLGEQISGRLLGILMGLVVAAYANTAPKALTPLIQMRCDPASEQRVRRFAGWTLTLGGVAYAATWLIVPYGSAGVIAMGLLGAAVLLVIARLTWALSRKARA